MHFDELFDRPAGPRTILAVSPHLDDAVLSAGATIAELTDLGTAVVVRTAFAGIAEPPFSPTADGFHELWGLKDDVVQARRAEDARAMASLGASPEFGTALDAIYRRDAAGAWLIAPHQENRNRHETADEPALEADLLAGVLGSIQTHRPEALLTAAAVGAHIDHVLTRNAAIAAARLTGLPIFLWEDMPYGIAAEDAPRNLLDGARAEAAVDHVTTVDRWRRKLEAIERYASQLVMLASDGPPVVEQIDGVRRPASAAVSSTRAERFWTVSL